MNLFYNENLHYLLCSCTNPIFGKNFVPDVHAFFINNLFMRNTRLKLAKNQAKAKEYPETKLLLFENHFISSSMLPFKTNIRYSKKRVKNRCFCFNEIIWLIVMKMRLTMKNRYNINKTRSRHGQKCTKYKICTMMVLQNKQHLSNIWSWIHEKVKQHWDWVKIFWLDMVKNGCS